VIRNMAILVTEGNKTFFDLCFRCRAPAFGTNGSI
jgi:hypothetical protein